MTQETLKKANDLATKIQQLKGHLFHLQVGQNKNIKIESTNKAEQNNMASVLCTVFGCGRELSLREQLCGTKCIIHTSPEPIINKKPIIIPTMTLAQQIESAVLDGFAIELKPDVSSNYVNIAVTRLGPTSGKTIATRRQLIPIDHLTEDKISRCIGFLTARLKRV